MSEVNTVFITKSKNTILFFFGFILFFILLLDLILPPSIMFIGKNLYLLILLTILILREKTIQKENWLLNPAILASIFTFILGFIITNYIHFIPGSDSNSLLHKQLGRDPFPLINYVMTLVILSAITMWIGYSSNLGDKLYSLLLFKPLGLNKYFRKLLKPNLGVIYILLIASVLARLYAIQLGVYGI